MVCVHVYEQAKFIKYFKWFLNVLKIIRKIVFVAPMYKNVEWRHSKWFHLWHLGFCVKESIKLEYMRILAPLVAKMLKLFFITSKEWMCAKAEFRWFCWIGYGFSAWRLISQFSKRQSCWWIIARILRWINLFCSMQRITLWVDLLITSIWTQLFFDSITQYTVCCEHFQN